MLVVVVIHDRSYCLMVPTWSAFLVHYFLHSSKHTLLSSQRRTTSIVVVVLSLEAHVLSLFFFLFEPTYTWVSALLGQLCSLCLSHSRSCAIHLREHGGTSSSFHACTHCECTRARCTSGNEHVIKEKNFLYSFFFLSTFPVLFIWFQLFFFGTQLLFINHSTHNFFMYISTYSFISKNYIQWWLLFYLDGVL
jgi:hypothetical protein